jgi:hypothetical protein
MVLAACAAVLALAAPSNASATGFQSLGAISYSNGGITVQIPSGCLLGHSIRGDGRTITAQWASVTCAPPASSWLLFHKAFCNPRIDFVFFDGDNREYYRQRGVTRYACYGAELPTWEGSPRVAGKYGKTCAQLYLNGAYENRQCHYIQP